MSKELNENINYVAYKAQEAELKKTHMGKWVAFSNGQMVASADDKEALHTILEKENIVGGFMHQVVAIERTFHFRSPRRPSRK